MGSEKSLARSGVKLPIERHIEVSRRRAVDPLEMRARRSEGGESAFVLAVPAIMSPQRLRRLEAMQVGITGPVECRVELRKSDLRRSDEAAQRCSHVLDRLKGRHQNILSLCLM